MKKWLIKSQIKLLINKFNKIKIFVLVLNNLFCEVLKNENENELRKEWKLNWGNKNKKKSK